MEGTVLIADDDRTIRTVLTQAFTRAGCQVHATSSLTTLLRWVEEGRGDLVITDVMMPDGNGLEMLPKIAQDRSELPVIVISAQNSIMTAIRAEQANAFDYIPKPFDLPDLLKRAGKALSATGYEAGPKSPSTPINEGEELALIGHAPIMQRIYARVARLLNTSTPLAITGPSGVGKTLLAETLHKASDRSTAPYALVLPEDLSSPEAAARVVALNRNGTVLIDEINSFGDEAQLWLRRRLDKAEPSDPRFLFAAQRSLAELIAAGEVRSDLAYRLSADEICLPFLSERLEDIAPLANHILAQGDEPGKTLSASAVDLLKSSPWPGNVRQLSAVVQIAARNAEGREITTEAVSSALAQLNVADQPSDSADAEFGVTNSASAPSGETLTEAVHRHISQYFSQYGQQLPPPGVYARLMREVERPLLEISLNALSGNQARAAELLGINRNTLRKKLNDLGMEVTRTRRLM